MYHVLVTSNNRKGELDAHKVQHPRNGMEPDRRVRNKHVNKEPRHMDAFYVCMALYKAVGTVPQNLLIAQSESTACVASVA